MTDDELAAWTRDVISRRTPESEMLDYKRTLSVEGRPARVELGKDVASFANDLGGVLLYGVPEDDSGPAPVPAALNECGISLAPNLAETVENILVETVDPPLPELCVRPLPLGDGPSKQVLFVWHPASWNRPHMVLYEDRRYYRRGNFRAVPMRPQEVEAAYASRRTTAVEAQVFADRWAQRRPVPKGAVIHLTVCPHFSALRPMDVLRPAFREWLFAQQPGEYGGSWIPFEAGWRFLPRFRLGYIRPLEIRLFNTGALAYTDALGESAATGQRLALRFVGNDVQRRLFTFGDSVWTRLGIDGPATVRVELVDVGGWRIIPETPWSGDESELPTTVSFDEETSIGEIRFSATEVLSRLLDRIAAAGGLWRS